MILKVIFIMIVSFIILRIWKRSASLFFMFGEDYVPMTIMEEISLSILSGIAYGVVG